jgi:hypothetical protein
VILKPTQIPVGRILRFDGRAGRPLPTASSAGGHIRRGGVVRRPSRHHMAGNMWFDGFVVPWIADVMPQTLAAPKRGTLVTALSSYLLLPLGWLLLGIASFRAGSTHGCCSDHDRRAN